MVYYIIAMIGLGLGLWCHSKDTILSDSLRGGGLLGLYIVVMFIWTGIGTGILLSPLVKEGLTIVIEVTR